MSERDITKLTYEELTAWEAKLAKIETMGGNTFGLLQKVSRRRIALANDSGVRALGDRP